jgi:succinate dehydrogenase / fumarate reductase, cytochrome b subunit
VSVIQVIFAVLLFAVLSVVGVFSVRAFREAMDVGGEVEHGRTLVARLLRTPMQRDEATRWAFLFHRVTGVAVFAFLCLHVLDVGVYGISRGLYDQLHGIYSSVPMRVFECALLFAILFHTFNGLRILAIDILDLGATAAGRLLAVVTGGTIMLGVAASVVILKP